VICGFKPRDGFQGVVYLIRDDTAGKAWDYQHELHTGRPFSVLKLVYSI
jgi:hypothetical protein